MCSRWRGISSRATRSWTSPSSERQRGLVLGEAALLGLEELLDRQLVAEEGEGAPGGARLGDGHASRARECRPAGRRRFAGARRPCRRPVRSRPRADRPPNEGRAGRRGPRPARPGGGRSGGRSAAGAACSFQLLSRSRGACPRRPAAGSAPAAEEVEERHEERGADDRPEDREGLPGGPEDERLRQVHLAGDPGTEERADEAEDDRDEEALRGSRPRGRFRRRRRSRR